MDRYKSNATRQEMDCGITEKTLSTIGVYVPRILAEMHAETKGPLEMRVSSKVQIGRQRASEAQPISVQVKEDRTVPSFNVTVFAGDDEVGSLFRPAVLDEDTLMSALADVVRTIDMDLLDPELEKTAEGEGPAAVSKPKGDPYKVDMLKLMLAHETEEGAEHYGAHLTHWWGDAKPLTIDAGGLRALIEYYTTHCANYE